MINDNQLNNIFQLSILANVLNCWDFFLNMEQISNDELMKALEHQNLNYLEQILKNQQEIIEKLNKLL